MERLARGTNVSDEVAADYIRDVRRVAEVDHPNIVRTRHIVIRAGEVLVVTDYLKGEELGTLLVPVDEPALPLELSLRVLIDVLTGLSALHNLRDVRRQPLKLVHGEITPANIFVGLDGTARLLRVCHARSAALRPTGKVLEDGRRKAELCHRPDGEVLRPLT